MLTHDHNKSSLSVDFILLLHAIITSPAFLSPSITAPFATAVLQSFYYGAFVFFSFL